MLGCLQARALKQRVDAVGDGQVRFGHVGEVQHHEQILDVAGEDLVEILGLKVWHHLHIAQ